MTTIEQGTWRSARIKALVAVVDDEKGKTNLCFGRC